MPIGCGQYLMLPSVPLARSGQRKEPHSWTSVLGRPGSIGPDAPSAAQGSPAPSGCTAAAAVPVCGASDDRAATVSPLRGGHQLTPVPAVRQPPHGGLLPVPRHPAASRLPESGSAAGKPAMRRRLWLVAVVCVSVAACSPQLGGEQGDLQAMAANCPTTAKDATFVTIDVSDTARSADVAASQLGVVRSVAEQTAVCAGQLRVSAFSSSPTATMTLFDGELAPPGATEPARLRRIPDLIEGTMQAVESKLQEATAELPGDGTDVLAQLNNAAEYGRQLGSAYVLHAVFVTDGVASMGVITNAPSFDLAAATDLATRVSVPDLSGSTVLFAGIGRTTGPPAPSSYVDALKRFYGDTCARTNARSCVVVTDFVTPRSGS